MNRLDTRPTKKGIHSSGLRTMGMLILLVGIAGRSLIQNKILGVGQLTTQELLTQMQSSQEAVILTSLALIIQALETCAAPIFCFLLVEGFTHTASVEKYFARVLGVALASEIPYNLAINGQLLFMGSRNPAFGMVLGLIVLYVYNRFRDKGLKNTAIKVLVTVAAVLWGGMLKISGGSCCVILVAVLWIFRKKPIFRNLFGCMAAASCSMLTPFFLLSPLGFIGIRFYNGEKGPQNRIVNYLAYPAMLLAAGLAVKFL